jgi:predicted ester cyclase
MASTPSPIWRIFDEAFNVGTLEVVDEVLAPDHHAHITIGGAPNGPLGLKVIIAIFRTAFPDLRCTVEDEIVVGDKFAARWALQGTHQGMFLGNPPTGKRVDIPGLVFGRTENERIIEDWILIDQMEILEQLGIVPPSGRHERKLI